MKTSLQIIAVLVIGLAAYTFGSVESQPTPLAGFMTTTVTSASTSVGMLSTTMLASSTNTQFFQITAQGQAHIHCAYGSASPALNVGEAINPMGSSTLTQLTISDPNKLVKGVKCIATATTTVATVKY